MIAIDETSRTPKHRQIYEALRDEILNGVREKGTKLPSLRKLAADLHVGRNTVDAAYSQLMAEGFIISRSGSGYTVEDVGTTRLPNAQTRGHLRKGENDTADRFAHEPFNEPKAARFDFTYGDRPRDSFPTKRWHELTDETLFSLNGKSAVYGDGFGEPGLRHEIALWLRVARGVNCTAEQVIVQPGTQAALGALLALFDPAHDTIAMEEPGYDGARDVFELRGFKMLPIPVNIDSQDAGKRFLSALVNSGARLAFLTPSSQFPLGDIMPLQLRTASLAWAERSDAYIIEDDYCCELSYAQRPIPSLQSLDSAGRVVYMGTFSKVLSPALRMSYLVLPPALLEHWRQAYARFYCPVPWLSQHAMELFMKKRWWEGHVRAVRTDYLAKRNALLESLETEMGGKIEVVGGLSGLHLLVGTLDGRGENELVRAAATEDVRVYPTSRYWMAPERREREYVLVGFSSIERELIPEGIARLRKAWFG